MKKIAIIGCGISGLYFANQLQNNELYDYTIYEKKNELNLNAIITNKAIKKGDMLETFADITASEDKLNYSPEINIEVGIPKLIKWFKEYYKC